MAEQQIHAHKVTKPMQLLAAWLVGLLLCNATFLGAALQLESGSWERGLLIVCAILNVPMFLIAWFILQTRFRAELQEDTFYSEYLSKKTQEVFRVEPPNALLGRIEALERHREALLPVLSVDDPSATAGSTSAIEWGSWLVALNELHPQVEDIRAALRSAQIPLAEFFGNPGDVPPLWVISINEHMPFAHQKYLLQTLAGFNFDGFHLWEPIRHAEENEDVYIGSYGTHGFTAITDQLSTLLSEDGVEAADLERYQRANFRSYYKVV